MFTCPICHSELTELDSEQQATCTFCGAIEETGYICPNGHYQCEDCRMATQTEIIERVSLNTKITDPIAIANLIMKHPSFNPYGVEHHELVAAACLAAMRNLNIKNINDIKLTAAIKRGNKIPYGACGSMGTCGACVSAGIAIGILTNSNYLKDQERNLTIRTTANALLKLTELGGPRCCKFSTYSSILAVWETATNELNMNLPPLSVMCDFQGILKECHLEKCPYYEKR
ncbi:MAG: DUF5714 domain-containing protein [Tenuifilum sp.]|uniref:DUF5714 domain-containing protein n=1 Tax=Tenuifilum sp. TaxID=2760880 RepID=UPI00309EB2A1